MARKSKHQYLYATESTYKFDYKTAKAFFRDIQKENKKNLYSEKGIKQRITRTQKLLNQAIGFKGSKKEIQQVRQKFLKSFEGLANKEYLDYDSKTNSIRKRYVVKREWYQGRQMFSRTKKFKVGRKSSYRYSGDVYDYDTFKARFDDYDPNERQKILNRKEAFCSGRYARWSTAVKSALGIDRSVSDATLLKWMKKYEKGE